MGYTNGFYNAPPEKINIFTATEPFEITTSHNGYIFHDLPTKVGDRFFMRAWIMPDDSDGVNFLVNLNGGQLIAFYSIIVSSTFPALFEFTCLHLEGDNISFFGTFGRAQTAPEYQSQTISFTGRISELQFVFYTDAAPHMGMINGFALDKISKGN